MFNWQHMRVAPCYTLLLLTQLTVFFSVAALLLGSLPESYNTLVTTMESRAEQDTTSQLIKSKLINENKRRKGAKDVRQYYLTQKKRKITWLFIGQLFFGNMLVKFRHYDYAKYTYVFDILNMVDFFSDFVISWGTEILIVWNFWRGVYI